jgi:hypothetical protein
MCRCIYNTYTCTHTHTHNTTHTHKHTHKHTLTHTHTHTPSLPLLNQFTSNLQSQIHTHTLPQCYSRTYIYKPEQQHAQEWLDLLLHHSKAAREKKTNMIMREEHGTSGVSLFRAKSKRFFWAPFVQMFSACLVIGGFVIHISFPHILPFKSHIFHSIWKKIYRRVCDGHVGGPASSC